jgi:hypothetical protein
MLWTTMDNEGNLTIQADTPIEAYALIQWEKNLPFKRAKLTIETGRLFDIREIAAALNKDVKAFAEWKREREFQVVLTSDEVTTLDSLKA